MCASELYITSMMQTFVSKNVVSCMFSGQYVCYDKQYIIICSELYYAMNSVLYEISILYLNVGRLASFASYAFSPMENWQSSSTKQQDACEALQESAEKETAKPIEKKQKKVQLGESLPQREQPENCYATSLPIAEACNNTLQQANDVVHPIPAPSSVCNLRNDDETINQADDSNYSAPARISYHQVPDDTTRPSQCKSRFSPQLTFRRRVKRNINLDEPAEENHSKDNDKGCSTLTCSSPSLLVNDTPLLKETDDNSLDTAYKVYFLAHLTTLYSLKSCSYYWSYYCFCCTLYFA
jgi:hypothetical protein